MADADTFEKKETVTSNLIPLADLLSRSVGNFAPGDSEAKALKDNLPRLEAIVREKLNYTDDAFKAWPVLEEALLELENQLAISGAEGEAFSKDISRLKKSLPKTGALIPFSSNAPVHILAAYLRGQLAVQRKALKLEIEPLIARLKDILAVEREKSPEAKSPDRLHSTLDFADSFLNFEELSSILPAGGSEAMPEDRYRRIEKILETLQGAEALLFGKNAYLIVSYAEAGRLGQDWEKSFPVSAIEIASDGRVCDTAVKIFDALMEKAAELFAAIRIGKLEVESRYIPEIHGDFFIHFDWRRFTDQELSACPPVLLLIEPESLLERELNDFSRMLSSNRPVKALVIRRNLHSGASPGEFAFRQEPGALAIAHRNAYVMQSASVSPEFIFDGFREGIDSPTPAVFHLFLPEDGEGHSGFLSASAAVEGREFPGFVFDSRKGPWWGSRFDIHNNPQPETDWPRHSLAIMDENGKETTLDLFFTYADFAAMDSVSAGQFYLVPPRYWSDDLVLISDYLSLPEEEIYSKVPFIWVVDENDTLQKAAVSWPPALTCRERLDFWRFLQENAGVHSYHVEQATEKLRREIEEETAKKIAALEASHLSEIEKAKEETARSAMEKLAATLLDMDVASNLADSLTPQPVPQARQATATPAAPDTPEVEFVEIPEVKTEEKPKEEALPLGEAWIETPLCTSCNECKDINSRIFAYDANKQAYVADPKGGPFADIVIAAEKCPVKIIHPGAPQNPDEPGLEELIKRAEPYQ
jgi:ferredoxin